MEGKRLGPYEIIEQLGVGGMGEVYRARDARLERDVAIKVLPPDFAADTERLARFEREAKLLAQLTHPNIAGIYGFEDADGVRFIAMECVPGATLAQRIEAEGRIETDEATAIAVQIAEALEAAHEAGIVHRDLKPANIKVTDDGTVKVLDFGLAKALAPDGSASDISPDISHSPTMAAATRTGVILGTAAYMPPEQARGKPLDKRADIWAFGCVLYEMLTGQRPFGGETVSDILAAIIRAEPDLDALPADTPPSTRRLIERCLRKEPRQRLRDAGDARLELQAQEGDEHDGTVARAGESLARPASLNAISAASKAALIVLAGVIGVAAYVIGSWSGGPTVEPAGAVRHLSLAGPEGHEFGYGFRASLAISRDGRRIAYTTAGSAEGAFGGQLWVQDLVTGAAPRPIAGAADAETPFFSPDGESIAFLAEGKVLRRVSLAGDQAPEDIAPASTAPGGVWADDGTIYFFPDYASPLQRIALDGSVEELFTDLLSDSFGSGLAYPALLPGGDELLVTRFDGADYTIQTVSLVTGEATPLVDRGRKGQYVPTGHILYARDSDLVAAPYDPATRALGAPVVLASDILVESSEAFAEFAVADDGTAVYLTADRTGRWLRRLRPGQPPERLNAEPLSPEADYDIVEISPAGDRLVMVRDDHQLWVFDLLRNQVQARLTRDGLNWSPRWSADGRHVVFNSAPAGLWGFWRVHTEPGAEPELLYEGPHNKWPGNFAPDGTLVFSREGEEGGVDVYLLPPGADPEPRALMATGDREHAPQISPDGRWIAYEHDNTGRIEVYVSTYPERTITRRISVDGGATPAFQADGSALYYVRGGTVYRVEILDPEAGLFSEPEPFVTGVDTLSWDVMPDGSAIIGLEPRVPPRLRLILGAAALFDGPGQDPAARR